MGGWPFLIARGRRRGYRVLLAPDVLPTYGFLDDDVLSVRPDARYQAGRVGGYFLVWNEYPLAEGEVEGPVRDEHSRPLVLTVGVLYPGDTIADDTELPRAHRVALDTYRRFLADEEGFRVERSAQFDPPTRAAPPAAERPTAHPEELAYAASRPLPPPPSRSGNRTLIAGAVGVAVVAAIAVVLAVTGSTPDPPPLPRCPATTTATPGTTTPSPQPPTPRSTPPPTPTPTPTPTVTPTCVP
ncbi:hypothetical protein SAMN05192558_105165 [Actinokineospora alba]|uniref:Uncharacterized protein n=1 Tax=Actinokineospora alba TaxID=504798 RepID=A0A1H0N2Q6_9PSEU|nr:hypothetical protein [Actinokineospora alba]TDP68538.1 hypothetical protein C8E96_4103 [Actinokineospora alba]SDH81226.1 hypothetical protein SAMN05421871_102215 [Actinokineospora alba]SDO86922.1 hypothetical protein SAMN05192558_105165 [Actinokineospora alba]